MQCDIYGRKKRMNSEILFRAKRIDNDEWAEGYIVKKHGEWFMYDVKNADTCRQNCYAIEKDTICRYTGLTDKDGEKIWENDIVSTENECIGVVKYGTDEYRYTHGFYIEWIKDMWYRRELGFWAKKEEIAVAGNVYDTPELLGKERKEANE